MMNGRYNPRKQKAAKTHAAHEHAQKHPQRDARRTDYQLKKLKPDYFINKGRTTASHK
jgi:hypothetical protein